MNRKGPLWHAICYAIVMCLLLVVGALPVSFGCSGGGSFPTTPGVPGDEESILPPRELETTTDVPYFSDPNPPMESVITVDATIISVQTHNITEEDPLLMLINGEPVPNGAFLRR